MKIIIASSNIERGHRFVRERGLARDEYIIVTPDMPEGQIQGRQFDKIIFDDAFDDPAIVLASALARRAVKPEKKK